MSEFTNSLVNLARTMESSEQSKLDRQMQSEQFDARNRLQLEMSRLNNEIQLKRDALSQTNQRRNVTEQRFYTLQEKLADVGVKTNDLYTSEGINEFNKDATGNMVEQMEVLDENEEALSNDTMAMMKAMDEMSSYQSIYSTAAQEGLGDIEADFAGEGVKSKVKTAEDVDVYMRQKYGNPDELTGRKAREYQAERAGYLSNLSSVNEQLQQQKQLKLADLSIENQEAAVRLKKMEEEGFTPETLVRNAGVVDRLSSNLVGHMRNELTLGGMPLIQYMADGEYNMQEINQQLSSDLARSTKLASIESGQMAPGNEFTEQELGIIGDVSARFMGVFDPNPEVAAMTLQKLFDDANSGDDIRAAAALGALRKISTDPTEVQAIFKQLRGLADLKTKIETGNFNMKWKNRAFHEEITQDLDDILEGSQQVIDKASSDESDEVVLGPDGQPDYENPEDYPTALPAEEAPKGNANPGVSVEGEEEVKQYADNPDPDDYGNMWGASDDSAISEEFTYVPPDDPSVDFSNIPGAMDNPKVAELVAKRDAGKMNLEEYRELKAIKRLLILGKNMGGKEAGLTSPMNSKVATEGFAPWDNAKANFGTMMDWLNRDPVEKEYNEMYK